MIFLTIYKSDKMNYDTLQKSVIFYYKLSKYILHRNQHLFNISANKPPLFRNYQCGKCDVIEKLYDYPKVYNFCVEEVLTSVSITIVSRFPIIAKGYVLGSMIQPLDWCYWSYATKWTIEYGNDINKMKILETKQNIALQNRGVYIDFPTREFIFKVFRFTTIERVAAWYGLHYLDIIGKKYIESKNYKKVYKAIFMFCYLSPFIDSE